MMNRRSAIVLFKVLPFVIILLISAATGCHVQDTHVQNEQIFNPIPRDQSVIRIQLDNGFKFLLRPVREGKTVEFALVVKTGAAAETKSEHGLAHFVEHMAFNGTERFPGNQIIALLGKSGVEFGSELNAFTTYNYTCFHFQIPANKPDLQSRSIQILEQWASAVRFDAMEVEKEKGIILEEIRAKDKNETYLHDLYRFGTRLEHHPILGTGEDIAKVTPEKLIQFYRRWYRPDRMALVAVGGFDEHQLINQIKSSFGHLRNSGTSRFKPWLQAPSADKKVLRTTNSQDGRSHVTLTWIHRAAPAANLYDLEKEMTQDFVRSLIQQHFSQTAVLGEDSITALKVKSRWINPKTRLDQLFITVGDDTPLDATGRAWLEILRLRRAGFSAKEIEIAKKAKKIEIDSADEFLYLNSETFRLIDSETYGQPLVNPHTYALLHKRFLPKITAQSVLSTLNEMFAADPNFIVLSLPAGFADSTTSGEIAAAILKKDLRRNRSDQQWNNGPELPMRPFKPGQILQADRLDILGIMQAERWRLSSGMTFYIKEIPDKNLISFYLAAPGGRNALNVEQLPAARFLPMFTRFGAIAHHTLKTYERNLEARGIDLHIFIKENLHGFRGSFPKKETAYALGFIHQLMTDASVDPILFQKVQREFIDSRSRAEALPQKKLSLRIRRLIYAADQRRRPPAISQYAKITANDVLSVYRQLFGNANGFHFFYMGDKNHIDLRHQVEICLGSLPHGPQAHRHVNHPVELSNRQETLMSSENPENRSDITLTFLVNGHDQSYVERLTEQALFYIVESRLDKKVREERSLVYSFEIDRTSSQYPATAWRITIRFACAPSNRERIAQLVRQELIALSINGPQEDEFQGAINHLRHRSEYLKNDIGFIISLFESQYVNGVAGIEGLQHQKLIENLTKADIARLAHICFNTQNACIQAELNPPGAKL